MGSTPVLAVAFCPSAKSLPDLKHAGYFISAARAFWKPDSAVRE